MMQRTVSAVLLIIVLCGCADDKADRVVAFKKGIHTGQRLQSEEWLAKDVRTAVVFTRYGGLDALVADSTGEAERNGGFRRARVVSVKVRKDISLVETEVLFRNGRTVSSIEAWTREDGKWKLTFRTAGE